MNYNGPILKLRKLVSSAIIPMPGSDWSAGLDCYTYCDYVVPPWSLIRVKLGFSICLPWEFYAQILPTIGLAWHEKIFALPGVVDPDSTAELEVSLILIIL